MPGEQPKDREYIKLNANESPYPPSPAVLEALRSAEAATALNLYPDAPAGSSRALLAGQFGLGEGNVLLANGSDDILNFCFLAFCERGVVFPDVSYGFYEVFADLYHIDARRPSMGEGLYDRPARLHRYGPLRGAWPTPTPRRAWPCRFRRWRAS